MDRMFVETKIDAGDGGEIEGLGWVFAQPDRVGDVIQKGAFADAKVPLPMLFGHDPNDPVGAWEVVEEADDGLRLKGRLLVAEVPRAREVQALVKAGAVRGLSVGFRTQKADRRGRGRTITKLELLEVSLVTMPCHPGAQVASAKSAVRALHLSALLNRASARLSEGTDR